MANDETLEDAYAMTSLDEVKALYRDWAFSYDAGFGDAQGYQLPRLVAQAYLAAGGHSAVLDVGAGTGLVADHLVGAGLDTIDALDVSDEMLAVAKMKDIYRDLYNRDVTQSLDLPAYDGVVSAGTFTLGHVGPSAIVNLLEVTKSGAVFVISVNAAHYETAGFAAQMDMLGTQIEGLTLTDVRIYDDRSDAAHRYDMARLLVFKKA